MRSPVPPLPPPDTKKWKPKIEDLYSSLFGGHTIKIMKNKVLLHSLKIWGTLKVYCALEYTYMAYVRVWWYLCTNVWDEGTYTYTYAYGWVCERESQMEGDKMNEMKIFVEKLLFLWGSLGFGPCPIRPRFQQLYLHSFPFISASNFLLSPLLYSFYNLISHGVSW